MRTLYSSDRDQCPQFQYSISSNRQRPNIAACRDAPQQARAAELGTCPSFSAKAAKLSTLIFPNGSMVVKYNTCSPACQATPRLDLRISITYTSVSRHPPSRPVCRTSTPGWSCWPACQGVSQAPLTASVTCTCTLLASTQSKSTRARFDILAAHMTLLCAKGSTVNCDHIVHCTVTE